MYFNTIVKNLTDKEIRVSFIGKSTVTLGPGKSVTVPYEILTACRNNAQKGALLSALQHKTVSIEYKTDVDITSEKEGKTAPAKKAPVAPVKDEPKVEEPKVEEPKVNQEEVLTEAAKEAIKKADEGSGIIEDVEGKDLLPKAVTLGDDAPLAEPKDVKLEDMMEGKAADPEPTKQDVVKDIKKSAPKTKKKKAPAKKAASKKAPAKKGKTVKMD